MVVKQLVGFTLDCKDLDLMTDFLFKTFRLG